MEVMRSTGRTLELFSKQEPAPEPKNPWRRGKVTWSRIPGSIYCVNLYAADSGKPYDVDQPEEPDHLLSSWMIRSTSCDRSTKWISHKQWPDWPATAVPGTLE